MSIFLMIFISAASAANVDSVRVDSVTDPVERTQIWSTIRHYCIAECIGLFDDITGSQCSYNETVFRMKGDQKLTPKPATAAATTTTPAPTANQRKFNFICVYKFTDTEWVDLAVAIDAEVARLCNYVVIRGFAELVVSADSSFSVKIKTNKNGDIAEHLPRLSETRVLVSIGEFTLESCKIYSDMADNSSARTEFVSQVEQIIRKYNFSGLDLNWVHPVCWKGACVAAKERLKDKPNFASLAQELHKKFEPSGLILSTTVPGDGNIIKQAYTVESLGLFTWLEVPTTDISRGWTGMAAGLLLIGLIEAMRPLVKTSVFEQFVMDVNLGALTYTIVPRSNATKKPPPVTTKNIMTYPIAGPGKMGNQTQEAGVLSFYEVCWFIFNDGWNYGKGFAMRDDQWSGFEVFASVKSKLKEIMTRRMFGVVSLHVQHDDIYNTCGCGKFPIIRFISDTLRGKNPTPPDCLKV